jgi:acyl phosphate:glycerol-3-phosphate acyltransferase
MSNNLLIIALVSYLVGSIPFGYILVKLFLKQDIRQTGSGNIGATNVARSGQKGLAIATLLLDAGKGAVAVYLGRLLSQPVAGVEQTTMLISMALAALFAIVGHCFPVWLKFKGGKGVATAIGAFAVLSPEASLAALICFALAFAISRYVSLASIISAVVFPGFVYWLGPSASGKFLLLCAASSLLIVAKHHANIRRLIAGTEPQFGKKAALVTDPIQTEKRI